MKYDSKQLSMELGTLYHNKEVAFQQYHKICGAIEMVEAMQRQAVETEKEEQAKIAAEEAAKSEIEPVPESAAA